MERAEARALLVLNTLPGLGPKGIPELVRQAGSAAALAAAPALWRSSPPGRFLPESAAEFAARAEREENRLAALGARPLCWGEDDYPAVLHQLRYPPPVIAIQGEASLLGPGHLRLALIGARACTPYGRSQARRFGVGLAGAGAVVVSGAARGIDQAGMRGALEGGGRVIAVLGSGLDCPYPQDARPLLEEILSAGGAILSEFPCGTPPRRGNFPRRNRILAALSRGVIVIQATRRSGSMSTLRHALDLGRDGFALPGPVDSVASRGPHQMLREGARLVEGPMEVIETYEEPLPDRKRRGPRVLRLLAEGDRSLGELAEDLGQSPERLGAELLELELQGRLTRLPGGLYHRVGPRPG